MKYRLSVLTPVFILLFCFTSQMQAKEVPSVYQIQLKAPDMKFEKVFLGQYFFGKVYGQDSLVLDKKGKGTFSGEEKLPEGLYVVYFKNSNYFDVLIGDDQEFSVKIDTLNLPSNIKFEGAGQTEDFYTYTMLLSKLQMEHRALLASKDSLVDSLAIKAIDVEIAEFGAKMKQKQDELIASYPDGMLPLFLKGLRIPPIPEFSIDSTEINPDSVLAVKQYRYYRNHYLDNIDYADERSFRTPYIKTTLETYLTKVVVQHYDSITNAAMDLIERSKVTDVCYKAMLRYVMNFSVKSKIMGMDKLMVEAGNKYFLSGDADWADTTYVKSLRREIKKVQTSLVGMTAHDIALADTSDVYRQIYDMGGEQLTFLFFYEPTCGHCKKTIPLVRDFYEKYKNDPRVNVLAVYLMTDKQEWLDFIKEQKLEILTNVWDPYRTSYYWHWFDTSSTPMAYALDKDHMVIAKKIDVETMALIAKYELK